eukprot:CAMPEP_0115371170 /NCGR_PEP_ID=MMETSP0271-20121206/231_1 /TAXON_ID=71861 /ORGANISM="Scrippsiella trochoidea, Strain CCMP3099" /LENGTH=55 /DNA_ID=CAMNT_0002794039 /DNA_START=576 /DNA_END=740 /DNA_ORIENTATION=+
MSAWEATAGGRGADLEPAKIRKTTTSKSRVGAAGDLTLVDPFPTLAIAAAAAAAA